MKLVTWDWLPIGQPVLERRSLNQEQLSSLTGGVATRGSIAFLLMEGFAEVAQALIAHFKGGFGDVVVATAEQLGRAIHANRSQILTDGDARFRGKGAAQIGPAAAHFLGQQREIKRLVDALPEQPLHFVHSTFRQAALFAAKELLFGWPGRE